MPASSVRDGLPAPTGRYQVGRRSFDWVDPDRAERFSADPQDRRELVVWVVEVEGSTHLSFMDVPFLPLRGDSPAAAMLAATQIESQRMWRITCDLLLAFFATHLPPAGTPPPLLTGPTEAYPALSFGSP